MPLCVLLLLVPSDVYMYLIMTYMKRDAALLDRAIIIDLVLLIDPSQLIIIINFVCIVASRHLFTFANTVKPV